jgi:hypothetical protein
MASRPRRLRMKALLWIIVIIFLIGLLVVIGTGKLIF